MPIHRSGEQGSHAGRPQSQQSAPGISFTVDAAGVVRTTMRGLINAADLIAHIRARGAAGVMNRAQLIDAREARLELTPEHLYAIADVIEQIRSVHGVSRTAFVAGEDFAYGMGRMYGAISERQDPGFAVFRSMSEAEAWLAG